MSGERSAKKKILFVCIGNMCRSQMAEGFARDYGGDSFDVYSAGTSATGVVSTEVIEVMEEKGIDISEQTSKGLEEVPVEEMDVVVSMARRSASEICPSDFKGEKIDWVVEDPIGGPMDGFRIVRDEIEEKVRALLKSIWEGHPASSS
jgi:arsenate reductase